MNWRMRQLDGVWLQRFNVMAWVLFGMAAAGALCRAAYGISTWAPAEVYRVDDRWGQFWGTVALALQLAMSVLGTVIYASVPLAFVRLLRYAGDTRSRIPLLVAMAPWLLAAHGVLKAAGIFTGLLSWLNGMAKVFQQAKGADMLVVLACNPMNFISPSLVQAFLSFMLAYLLWRVTPMIEEAKTLI